MFTQAPQEQQAQDCPGCGFERAMRDGFGTYSVLTDDPNFEPPEHDCSPV